MLPKVSNFEVTQLFPHGSRFSLDCRMLPKPLEEIDVSYSYVCSLDEDLHAKALASGLKKLRKVDLSGTSILQDSSILTLCQNCLSLEALAVHVNGTLELIDALVSLKCLTCLDLSGSSISDEALRALADGVLPLRELSLRDCFGYQYSGLSCLLRKCNNLQYLDIQRIEFLNDECVIELSLLLGNMKVVNLSENIGLTVLSLFAIMRNCPFITEIRMENTDVGKKRLQEDCLVVNSHLKFLYLAHNSGLDDECVTMLASLCPNLEMMDLSHCERVSVGAVEVLWRCCKIQRMDLSHLECDLSQFQFRVNFEVPTLFVLNLSQLSISNEELSLISKSCYNLKNLKLDHCDKITTSGVKQVVKNCSN